MQAGRQLLMRHPRLGLVVLALVLGLRVLIPPGMMPVPDGARGIVVALCDGNGPATLRTVLLKPDARAANDPRKTDGSANPGPCAFGVLADALIGSGQPVALPLPVGVATPLAPHRTKALALAALAHALPPARAPPALPIA
ncbi:MULTISPECIES: hypothetical protein [unclassified Novosphingobium]|uniref:hypothetical protein n=1 Tax=unclassified Novosphingobium TaxID=2644732 RepID=UPI00146D4A1D|nr:MULTISPECIES: hypothetical protein [unclassified Novosphingobium]NMN05768.1 hypothetical protein [Novosphingobium sp. SG919]NMN87872.1 hypothetical protein [Novosphingobium sp. SG916]